MMPTQSSTVDDSSHGFIHYGNIRWLVDVLWLDGFDSHSQLMAVLWIKGLFFTGVMFMH
jgi:hypothetical protein